MTPDERTLLTTFLQDLHQARSGLKDAEASAMIDQAIRSNPDAAYLLVQHAILADQALHSAEARISELESQGHQRAQPGGGFLGGGASPGPWGARQGAPPPYAANNPPDPRYQAQPQYHAQPAGAPEPRPGLFGAGPAQLGGFGAFLRNAGTTAAGVAGGAFLFDGLSSLFGGHRGWGGGFGAPPVENVTINEYGADPGYGSDTGGDFGYDDGGGFDDAGFGGGGYDDGGVG
jgi:uncharacterized protein